MPKWSEDEEICLEALVESVYYKKQNPTLKLLLDHTTQRAHSHKYQSLKSRWSSYYIRFDCQSPLMSFRQRNARGHDYEFCQLMSSSHKFERTAAMWIYSLFSADHDNYFSVDSSTCNAINFYPGEVDKEFFNIFTKLLFIYSYEYDMYNFLSVFCKIIRSIVQT